MSEHLTLHGIHLVQNSADHVGMATDSAFGEFTMFDLGPGMQI